MLALKIWEIILVRNAGCPCDYILDRLPYAQEETFVDASSSWGIGVFKAPGIFYSQTSICGFSGDLQEVLLTRQEGAPTKFTTDSLYGAFGRHDRSSVFHFKL